jgi:hypothetical protein
MGERKFGRRRGERRKIPSSHPGTGINGSSIFYIEEGAHARASSSPLASFPRFG